MTCFDRRGVPANGVFFRGNSATGEMTSFDRRMKE
jgi:hypothetical protein